MVCSSNWKTFAPRTLMEWHEQRVSREADGNVVTDGNRVNDGNKSLQVLLAQNLFIVLLCICYTCIGYS